MHQNSFVENFLLLTQNYFVESIKYFVWLCFAVIKFFFSNEQNNFVWRAKKFSSV